LSFAADGVRSWLAVAIPDFQTLMRPLLEAYASGDERPISDVRHELAMRFDLSEEELAERLPSGLAKTFDNRVGWAATYLYRTGLLARPRRAVYAITERGRDVFAAHPSRVDLSVLSQFPEFEEFRRPPPGGRRRRAVEVTLASGETATPEERIDAAYQELRRALAAELLERVHTMPPSAFEDLVLDVLHAMGYGSGAEDARLRTGGGGDRGIDGVIREDKLGLDVVYVQAKRWGGSVGRPIVQAFVGALQGARASKGIIFAASTFSPDADEYAATVSPRVILIDGERLADLMIDHNVGVAVREVYEVKRVDRDYFGDDA
jgi:restriction system protein